jgi:uncharacterized cupin superfamily protein
MPEHISSICKPTDSQVEARPSDTCVVAASSAVVSTFGRPSLDNMKERPAYGNSGGANMASPIVNVADVKLQPRPEARAPTGAAKDRFEVRTGRVGSLIGARTLGYNITAVPPGKSAYPFHSHRINEEMFFVLQGQGEVRIGEQVHPVRTGDFIACPAGGVETAHQIRNTGVEELRYLAVSTLRSPEVCEYPDSGKFGVYASFPPDADGKREQFHFMGRESSGLDYWDGEGFT